MEAPGYLLTYIFCTWFSPIFICAELELCMAIFVDTLTPPVLSPLLAVSTILLPKNPNVVTVLKLLYNHYSADS